MMAWRRDPSSGRSVCTIHHRLESRRTPCQHAENADPTDSADPLGGGGKTIPLDRMIELSGMLPSDGIRSLR